MAKKIFITFTMIALVAFFTAPVVTAEDAPGKKAFLDGGCNSCHAVESQAIEKTGKVKAADLSNVGAERTKEWIGKYLKKEEAIEGKKHMKAFKGSDEELQALIDWLSTLKKSE